MGDNTCRRDNCIDLPKFPDVGTALIVVPEITMSSRSNCQLPEHPPLLQKNSLRTSSWVDPHADHQPYEAMTTLFLVTIAKSTTLIAKSIEYLYA